MRSAVGGEKSGGDTRDFLGALFTCGLCEGQGIFPGKAGSVEEDDGSCGHEGSVRPGVSRKVKGQGQGRRAIEGVFRKKAEDRGSGFRGRLGKRMHKWPAACMQARPQWLLRGARVTAAAGSPFLSVQMLESVPRAGSPSPRLHPKTAPSPSSHLLDGGHAHSFVVVQGRVGCVHVVAKACDCHFITAMESHGHRHTAKGWDVLEEKSGGRRVEFCGGGWVWLRPPELIGPFPRMELHTPPPPPEPPSPPISFPRLPCQILLLPAPESHPPAHEAVVEGQSNESEGSLLDEVWIEDADLRGLLGHAGGHRLPEAIGCTL